MKPLEFIEWKRGKTELSRGVADHQFYVEELMAHVLREEIRMRKWLGGF